MNLENIISILLLNFPEIKEKYEAEKEDIGDLPYCVFDTIFIKYIIEVCKNNDEQSIKKICDFLEKMAQSSDENINNLFGVSVIEPLLYENETLSLLRKHMKEKTLCELSKMENWKPEKNMTHNELLEAFEKKK